MAVISFIITVIRNLFGSYKYTGKSVVISGAPQCRGCNNEISSDQHRKKKQFVDNVTGMSIIKQTQS